MSPGSCLFCPVAVFYLSTHQLRAPQGTWACPKPHFTKAYQLFSEETKAGISRGSEEMSHLPWPLLSQVNTKPFVVVWMPGGVGHSGPVYVLTSQGLYLCSLCVLPVKSFISKPLKAWLFEVVSVAKLHQKGGWWGPILQTDSSTPQHLDVPKTKEKGFYYQLPAFVQHLPKLYLASRSVASQQNIKTYIATDWPGEICQPWLS